MSTVAVLNEVMTTKSTTKLKFVRVEDWYSGLSRYEAVVDTNLGYGPVRGKFVIEANPSEVYEGRISSWTVQWHADGDDTYRGREIGSINTRFGRAEIKFTDAKKAAQADRDSWTRSA